MVGAHDEVSTVGHHGQHRAVSVGHTRRSGRPKPCQFQRPLEALVAGYLRIPVESSGEPAPYYHYASRPIAEFLGQNVRLLDQGFPFVSRQSPKAHHPSARTEHPVQLSAGQARDVPSDDDQIGEEVGEGQNAGVCQMPNGHARPVKARPLDESISVCGDPSLVRVEANHVEPGTLHDGLGQGASRRAEDEGVSPGEP